MRATLLIELLTEELPPKALPALGEAFAATVRRGLVECKLTDAQALCEWFATPRRLAVLAHDVLEQGPDELFTEKIMPVTVAFDAKGQPSAALLSLLGALCCLAWRRRR